MKLIGTHKNKGPLQKRARELTKEGITCEVEPWYSIGGKVKTWGLWINEEYVDR